MDRDQTLFAQIVAVSPLPRERHSPDDLRHKAAQIDSSAFAILVIAIAVAVASLVAVFVELSGTRCADAAQACLPALERDGRVALTAATILCSWFFVQMIFAVHYTHTYYGGDEGEAGPRGGLDFRRRRRAAFRRFRLFLGLGRSRRRRPPTRRCPRARMRRIVTAHAIFAFFFNTTVLALTINIAAGLVG